MSPEREMVKTMVTAFVAAAVAQGYMEQIGTNPDGEPVYRTTPAGQAWADNPRGKDDPVLAAMMASVGLDGGESA